jgi:hypothetical protein
MSSKYAKQKPRNWDDSCCGAFQDPVKEYRQGRDHSAHERMQRGFFDDIQDQFGAVFGTCCTTPLVMDSEIGVAKREPNAGLAPKMPVQMIPATQSRFFTSSTGDVDRFQRRRSLQVTSPYPASEAAVPATQNPVGGECDDGAAGVCLSSPLPGWTRAQLDAMADGADSVRRNRARMAARRATATSGAAEVPAVANARGGGGDAATAAAAPMQ